MARDLSDATPIAARRDLVEWIAGGEKPAADWRLGTEHEKVPFYRETLRPVPYEGERGIRALLEGLAELNGWAPILEDDHPIGLASTTPPARPWSTSRRSSGSAAGSGSTSSPSA